LLDQTATKSARVIKGRQGEPLIDITMTDEGRKQLARVTREHLNQQLAIVIDGRLWSAPSIQAEISGGKAEITGNFTTAEAEALAAKINEAVGK